MSKSGSTGLALQGERLVINRQGGRGFLDPRFLVAILLTYVARGDGEIADSEMTTMLDLVSEAFGLEHAEASSHLSRAMAMFAQNMDLNTTGQFLQESLDDQEKEDVVLMLLKVAAADGEQKVDEIRAVDEVVEALSVAPNLKHQAYQRFFSEQEVPASKRRL